jgi:hypothetical protein
MSLITQVRTKADAAVRGQAETVVGTARFAATLAGNLVEGAAHDVRSRLTRAAGGVSAGVNDAAGRATGVAATLAGAARKQALVTVGAGDVVVDALTARAEALPVEVQRNAGRSAATASLLARSARTQVTSAAASASTAAASVRARGGQAVHTARAVELPDLDVPAVLGAVDARVDAARGRATSTYDQLAARGETVVRSVRRDRRVLNGVTEADHVAEELADELSSVAG